MQNGRKKKVFLLIATEGNVQSQQKLSLFSERPFQGILLSRPPLLQHVDSTLWVELYRRRESPNFYSQCFPRDCNWRPFSLDDSIGKNVWNFGNFREKWIAMWTILFVKRNMEVSHRVTNLIRRHVEKLNRIPRVWRSYYRSKKHNDVSVWKYIGLEYNTFALKLTPTCQSIRQIDKYRDNWTRARETRICVPSGN